MERNIDQLREQLDDKLYEERYGGPDVCPQCNRNYGTEVTTVCSETMDNCEEACLDRKWRFMAKLSWWKRILTFFYNWEKKALKTCEFRRTYESCARCGEDMSE